MAARITKQKWNKDMSFDRIDEVSQLRKKPHCFKPIRRAVPYGLSVIALIIVCGNSSSTFAQRPEIPGADDPTEADVEFDDFHGIYLAADRSASRGLSIVRERIAAGEFGQAVEFLDKLLGRDEDAFVAESMVSGQFQGIKATARRIIGGLPLAGRDAYLLACSARAKNALDDAVEKGDLQSIRSVARRYFHTPAGFEATMILARNEHDHGRWASAAALHAQLLNQKASARAFGPRLHCMAAMEFLRAGRVDAAADVLMDAREDFPNAHVTIDGATFDLSSAPETTMERLRALTGDYPRDERGETLDWTMFRGSPARNADVNGGLPHWKLRWRTRVANDHHVERVLSEIENNSARRGEPRIPAVHPIAIGDVIVMRSTNELIGVDFQSGKRIWSVRAKDESEYERLAATANGTGGDAQAPQLARALEKRMWEDAPFGMLSSDGERVFAVRGLEFSDQSMSNPFQLRGAFVRRGVGGWAQGAPEPMTNTLSAFELRTEGKRVWEIDGAEVGGTLAGAFFLGPPLPVDGRLYVLAEIKSGIHLITLSADEQWPFWRLDWIQQLANLEIGIDGDPIRRFSGATPSYQDGVLVCPTSSGAVVAVDVIQQALLWAYRYPTQVPDDPQGARVIIGNQRIVTQAPDRTWIDGTVTIDRGRVFLTPAESSEIHCLDLMSGELLWTQPRETELYLAAVADGNLLLVGDKRLRALRADDGAPSWKQDIDLPDGVTPSGRGFLADGRYFLPLSNQEVVALDVARGEIAARARLRNSDALGNLICHRGAVISQNARFLDKFDQLDLLEASTRKALETNPDDPIALRSSAEIELNNGNIELALRHIRRAHAVAPNDVETDALLVSILLEALEGDFGAYQEDLALIERLAIDPDQKWRLARIEAVGLEQLGRVKAAASAYIQLAIADQNAPRQHVMSSDWSTPASAWISAQLASLQRRASFEERSAIADQLAPIEQSLGADPSLGMLRRHLKYFSGVGRGEQLALQLARKLIEHEAIIDGELRLLQLAESSEESTRAAATALLSNLYHAVGRHRAAERYDQALANEFANIRCFENLTGADLASRRQAQFADARIRKQWPNGFVKEQVNAMPRLQSRRGVDRYHGIRFEGAHDPVLEGYLCFVNQQPQQNVHGSFVLQDPYGMDELVAPFSSEDQAMRFVDLRGRRCHAVSRGGVIAVSVGNYIMAVNALSAESSPGKGIMWGTGISDGVLDDELAAAFRNRNHRGLTGVEEFGQHGRWFAMSAEDEPLGVLGPITSHGVAFQSNGQLKCVDVVTGRTIWTRSDMPNGCLLLGDDEILVAFPPDGAHATLIRMEDGERLGERPVPPIDQHVATQGRSILSWRKVVSDNDASDAGSRELVLYDVVDEKPIWTRTYEFSAKVCLGDASTVGVIERSGRFRLYAIEDGAELIDQPIAAEPHLDDAHIIVSRDDVILVTNRPGGRGADNALVYSILDTDYPIVTGNVYMFDRESGRPRWGTPASVELHGLALWQPRESPVIPFVSNVNRREQQSRTAARVLCLARSDGRAISMREDLKQTAGRCRIETSEEDNTISILLTTQQVDLEFTDESRPPEPPYDQGVEVGQAKKKRSGILNLFRSLK